jgi:hypothetical protein
LHSWWQRLDGLVALATRVVFDRDVEHSTTDATIAAAVVAFAVDRAVDVALAAAFKVLGFEAVFARRVAAILLIFAILAVALRATTDDA